MKKFILLTLFMVVSTGGCSATRAYKLINFNIHCESRLKRAADANTVETAAAELDAVVKYLEQRGMTEGYTSVLWLDPSEDVGFWYNNLKSALGELRGLAPTATPLEKSNMLIKLRETILDHTHNGDRVTTPDAVALFPHNTAWYIANWACTVVFLVWSGFGFRLLVKLAK